ncbi:MAG TPA: hypothetical protein VFU29_00400 [Chitinophagaceae bacterium]|nr:hypothetical protein [Chitinophagaceae bacterium]
MRKYLVLISVCICSVLSWSQNVGIGTSNPQNKLHVAGGFRLDTLTGIGGAGLLRHDANGVVYGIKFSGSASDVLLGNGTFGSPPGTGSGTNFWSANGNHIYNSNTGNVGVGTTAPQSKFHANGTSWFTGDNTPLPAAAGKGIAIGQSGENGYIFSFDYSTFTPKNLLLQSPGGNVGIGTTTPSFTLDINAGTFGGGTRTYSDGAAHFIAQTTGGTNSWARYYMRSPSQSWFIGTSHNFAGNQLYIVDETANQTRMAIQTNGNVGIGTGNPLVKLHVNGLGAVESSVQSTNERSILSLNSTIGGQNRVWTLENGLFGTAGLFGIFDRTAGQGRLTIQPGGPINMQGNTTQDVGSYGLPKAMVYVNGDGTLLRCYNGVTGSSSGGCGITASRFGSSIQGLYVVNFGFDISTHFISVTAEAFGGAGANFIRQSSTPTQLFVYTFEVFSNGDQSDRPFMVIVY